MRVACPTRVHVHQDGVQLMSQFHLDKRVRVASIIRQIGCCVGGNFNIHIWAWSASPNVQVGRL